MLDSLHFLSKTTAITATFMLFVLWTKPEVQEAPPKVFISSDISSMMENAKLKWCKKRLNCMKVAEAVYFESRSEGDRGMIAVANVIMNRSAKSNLKPFEVITKKSQFSYLSRTDFTITDLDSHRKSMLIATDAVRGELKDITHGATHYLAPKRLKRQPKWVKSFEKTIAIADHNFYRS